MDEKKIYFERVHTLANRIYNLDRDVYQGIGSDLGRVYNDERKRSVTHIIRGLEDTSQTHILRAEIALIGNMLKTLPEGDERASYQERYNKILQDLEQVQSAMNGIDIIDSEAARVNALNIGERFGDNHRLIVCISRSYGCGGNNIGFELAARLGIKYYDAEVLKAYLPEEGDINQDERIRGIIGEDSMRTIGVQTPNPGAAFADYNLPIRQRVKNVDRFHGLPARDAHFFMQSDRIISLARQEDFVIMGRCAASILKNANIPRVSLFITAPEENRIRRLMEVNHTSRITAKRQMMEVDRLHRQYFEDFTGKKWGDPVNYDLTINTVSYGLEGTVEFLIHLLMDAGLVLRGAAEEKK